MLDIGIQELLVIMVLALLIFGPDKLPDLGRRLGRAMREFRRASDEFRSTVEQNLQINADHDISPPSPSPVEPQAATPVASVASGSDSVADGSSTEGTAADSASRAGVTEGQAEDDLLEPYWTSRGGRLLHRRECAWRGRVPVSERIPIKAALDGWEQGLKPCPVCDPKEAAVAS
jgi:TatA/E family protein of Tat protein translocase